MQVLLNFQKMIQPDPIWSNPTRDQLSEIRPYPWEYTQITQELSIKHQKVILCITQPIIYFLQIDPNPTQHKPTRPMSPYCFEVSRIEPLWSPAFHKMRLMDASKGLPAGAIPSVVKVLRPKNHLGWYARLQGPARPLKDHHHHHHHHQLYSINYFQKITCFTNSL